MKSKEETKNDIRDQLYWDYRIDATNIDVEVENGTVILKGTVPNFLAKKAAELDVKSIRGVISIKNEIEVEFPKKISIPDDKTIEKNIEESLILHDSIKKEEISIFVEDGVVRLSGIIDAFWKKETIENLASNMAGVKSVVNEIGIVPTENLFDKDIARGIMDTLHRNAYVDADDVNVKVENGVVSLSGTVKDWLEHKAVFDSARFTNGTREIIDNLIIKQTGL